MTTRLWTGVLLALTACSGGGGPPKQAAQPEAKAAPAEREPAATATDTGGLGAPKIPWKDKSRDQRLEYMGLFVLDKMGALFAQWRPEEYAAKGAWRCQSCHGDGFDKPPVDFHMPRVAFPLDPDDPIGKAMKYDAEATTFMVEKVVPTMAELLSEKPMAEGGTFGCFRCHPKKGEKVP